MGEEWDIDSIKEEDWEEKAVYLVPDTPTEENCPNHATLSLPRNLVLKPSGTITDVSMRTPPRILLWDGTVSGER